MIFSLDTECTGGDFWHGCRPFYVSTCTPDGDTKARWHWRVNYKNRTPIIPRDDVEMLRDFLLKADTIVFHNAKFDIRALESIGIRPDLFWNKHKTIHDTMLMSHVMWSGESHALKDLCLLHLDIPDTDEDELERSTIEARKHAKSLGWDIARSGHPHFPGKSKNSKDWHKMDYWVPGQVAQAKSLPKNHPWHTVLQKYAVCDAERTILLYELLKRLLEDANLWKQYIVRRNLIRPVYEMENRGLSLIPGAFENEHARYTELRAESRWYCSVLAANPQLNLNSNPQVSKILFEDYGLTPVERTKTGFSVNADTVDHLLETTRNKSKPGMFLRHLSRYRKTDKCLGFLDSYLKYSTDHVLHPNILITGTGTTRFSSQNPNGQNVSRQEKYNLRRVFGPAPGRMWLSVDYANIELRMLAYAADEKELIAAFERGESVHMNFAWVVCPWAILKCPKTCTDSKYQKMKDALSPADRKKLERAFKETEQYHWVKNGDFALTYGATEAKADVTYHIPGAYQKIRGYFTNLASFMRNRVESAYKTHKVTTLGGYVLQIPYGREYTTAVDYYCQGSAGYVMCLGMLNCHQMLEATNLKYPGYMGSMLMQIHDELLFDLPADHHQNKQVISLLRQCMEMPGKELGVPIPTEAKLIKTCWAEGEVYDG